MSSLSPSTPASLSANEAEELGGLAMLQAIARKVAAMQRTAHDNTMRQEGAAAAFAALGKRLEQLPDESGTKGSKRLRAQAQALVQNMHQAALHQMTQQSGRALQAGEVLEACRALSSSQEVVNAKDA